MTVRDRDTTEQVRVPIDGLVAELRRRTGEGVGPRAAQATRRYLRTAERGEHDQQPEAPRERRPDAPGCRAGCRPPSASGRRRRPGSRAGAWRRPGATRAWSLTGTKADEAKMSGKRIGNTMSWAVSAFGADSPTVAKPQLKRVGEEQHDQRRRSRNEPKLVPIRKPTAKPTPRDERDHEDVAHQVGRRPSGQHGRAGHGQRAEPLDQPLLQVLGQPDRGARRRRR